MIIIFTLLAALTSFCMGALGGYAIYREMFIAAGLIFGVGTLIVFTLGRLNGMREMLEAIQEQNSKETNASDLF